MDINNYSYTPYMLDEAEPAVHKDKYHYWSIHDIRSISLDLCCDFIPGYRAAALETKNFIYDRVQQAVTTLINMEDISI